MNKTLRQLRIEKGWTLVQLGERIAPHLGRDEPVKAGVVSDWELTGRCHPSVVPALALTFDITVQQAREVMEATEAAAKVPAEAAE